MTKLPFLQKQDGLLDEEAGTLIASSKSQQVRSNGKSTPMHQQQGGNEYLSHNAVKARHKIVAGHEYQN